MSHHTTAAPPGGTGTSPTGISASMLPAPRALRLRHVSIVLGTAATLLVAGCATILGADFDRDADLFVGGDGGRADGELVTQIPAPEVPGPGGTCAEERKLCGGSCISHFEPNVGCGGATCEPCSRAQAVAACTVAGRCAIASCEGGWSDCNANPTDGCESELANDPKNCGGCGQPCSAGLVCAQGTCVSSCPQGTRACNGACKTESVTSCGASCAQCAVPAYGAAICTPAGCDFTCRSGYARSGATCIDSMPSNTWTQMASLPTARGALAAVATGGRIYAIGGSSTKVLPTLEAYDPSTDVWTKLPDMPTARLGLAAAVGADGRIYAIGGGEFDTETRRSTVEAYSPVTSTWTSVASMPTARMHLAAVTGQDGRIYALGGTTGPTGAGVLSTVEVYTPGTNSWASVASMPTKRVHLAAAVGPDGRIYAIGGEGPTEPSTVNVYTPGTNTWTSAANMPTGRLAHGVAEDAGRFYAIGGLTSASTDAYTSLTEIYVPGTNTWTPGASMPTARSFLATVAVEGRIYAIGGQRKANEPRLSTVEVYKP